jgi:hypothetical protein
MTNPTSTMLVPPPDRATRGEVEDIREVKPPVPIPSVWEWLGPVLIGLVLALAIWLGWRAWRRRRGAVPSASVLMIPPHVRARDRLREALGLIGQPKPFCVAISLALRVYLEERFQLRAPERTTEEFLEELQLSPRLSLRQKESLGEFLTRCDLVKFARHEPGEFALRELFDAAMRLVEETAMEPEVSGADAGVAPSGMGISR